MAKIIIREADNTTPEASVNSTDIVYIPGFVANDNADSSTIVAQFTPTLCTSVAQFQKLFGVNIPKFASDQAFPSAFSANAKTVNGVMFPANAYDPSYVEAYELLLTGIPVVYERVNGGTPIPDPTATVVDAYIRTSGDEFTGNWLSETSASDSALSPVEGTYYKIASSGTFKDKVYIWNPSAGESGMYSESAVPTVEQITAPAVEDMYKALAGSESDSIVSVYDKITDLGQYTVKYLTSGGYATFEYDSNIVAKKMLTLASDSSRGDCVALIDHTNNPARSLDPAVNTSVYAVLNASSGDDTLVGYENNQFGAMFTPFATYGTTRAGVIALPASYAYLKCLATAVAVNNTNWLAIAGVTRGMVPGLIALATDAVLTNTIADAYQQDTSISINAITNIQPYGNAIWGNRTLKQNPEGLSATSCLNIRSLICDIKKTAYTAARRLMFEQNNEILWINFKSMLTPLLDRMRSGYGIENYKFVKLPSSTRNELKCKISIIPEYPVEVFDITLELIDSEDITVVEG